MVDENVVLEQILYLSCRMAETRDLQPLLIYAVDVALDLFNAEHGYIILRALDDALDFRVKRQRHGGEIETPEVSHQILGRVLSEGQPVTTANALEDPAFDTSPSVHALNLRSVMCVPLIARDNILGALYLDNRLEQNVFTDTDLKYLQLFANQAAISIENAILNEDLEARVQARTAELNAYAHTVAHDLKNPMATIVSYAAWLEGEWQNLPADEIEQALKYMSEGGGQLSNIIDELLLLATIQKQDQIQVQAMDMAAIVISAQKRLVSQIHQRQAEIRSPEDWPVAVGHAPWIEEVWTNYLSNAIKYGGTPPQITLGADSFDATHVRFWVQDNGPGIASEDLSRLFVEFARLNTTHTEGHGLGLSIVQRIVERLGGQVGVESRVGAGSRFWFTLPVGDITA